jgi:hypothetical protein
MAHPLTHGIHIYFAELAANHRRVARALLAVSAIGLTAVAIWGRKTSEILDPMRFGYEGAEQWVEHIRLEELSHQQSPGIYSITYLTIEKRKGGEQRGERSSHPNARVATRLPVGEGESDSDLLAKARMMSLEGPLVRSEDLIIERLVQPVYPDEAVEKGIVGLVIMVALVDTSGAVQQIQIVGGAREPLLEFAAAEALFQCRYRPYRVAEHAKAVWAMFRMNFTLY